MHRKLPVSHALRMNTSRKMVKYLTLHTSASMELNTAARSTIATSTPGLEAAKQKKRHVSLFLLKTPFANQTEFSPRIFPHTSPSSSITSAICSALTLSIAFATTKFATG